MTSHHQVNHLLLGTLSNLHQMMAQLVIDLPADQVNHPFHPHLPPVGWLFGRAVFLETHWIRGLVTGETDLADRVRHIFGMDHADGFEALLPPKDHLLQWANEIQDEHLSRLANPRLLPSHPLLEDGFLLGYLIQVEGILYEQMLAVLTARAIGEDTGTHKVASPMVSAYPEVTHLVEVQRGHYRIGAREGVVFDNEQPAQIVELSSFRICVEPISNSLFLAYMENQNVSPPWHWRQDAVGHYYGIGLNGPFDLLPDEPVHGLSQQQAIGLASWASNEIKGLEGAVLQHEYQWEVSARTQKIKSTGRVWEWCANTFQPYSQYEPPEDKEMATQSFDGSLACLRGGSIHTQPSLRRSSLRIGTPGMEQNLFAGARLVLPPQQ